MAAYDPSTTSEYNLMTVASLSTYQLRQELVHKGVFDKYFKDDSGVCHDTLLAAMVSHLREEKAKDEQALFEKHNAEAEERKAKMAAAKEARKKEALERSRLRREAAAQEGGPNPRAVSKEELPPRNGKVVVVSETPAAAPEDKENAEAAAEPSNAIEDDRYAIPTEG